MLSNSNKQFKKFRSIHRTYYFIIRIDTYYLLRRVRQWSTIYIDIPNSMSHNIIQSNNEQITNTTVAKDWAEIERYKAI